MPFWLDSTRSKVLRLEDTFNLCMVYLSFDTPIKTFSQVSIHFNLLPSPPQITNLDFQSPIFIRPPAIGERTVDLMAALGLTLLKYKTISKNQSIHFLKIVLKKCPLVQIIT